MRCLRAGSCAALLITFAACGGDGAAPPSLDARADGHAADAGRDSVPMGDAPPAVDADDGTRQDGGDGGVTGLRIVPANLDFGPVAVGGFSAPKTIEVSNAGTASVTFSLVVTGAAPDFVVALGTCDGTPLSPGSSCTLDATARPSATGARTASLSLLAGGGVAASASLNVTGVTLGLTASPASVMFPSTLPGQTSGDVAVTFTNERSTPAGPLVTRVAGQGVTAVRLRADGCTGKTLGQGQSCVVTMAFAPSEMSNVNAQLSLLQQGSALASVPITGQVSRPASLVTDISDLTLSAGPGEIVNAQVLVTNPGDFATGPVSIAFATAAGPFSIATPDECTGKALAPGTSCRITVRFTSAGDAPSAARITVKATPGGSADVTFHGNKAPASLIGRWRFDDDLSDASMFFNDGSLRSGTFSSNAPPAMPTFVAGHEGSALQLDGKPQWVLVPRSASLDSTGDTNAVSAAAWIKADGFATGTKPMSWILSRHEAGSMLEWFGLGLSNGAPTCSVHFVPAVAATPVPLGKWVHVAATYDGLTCKVFQDGQEVATLDVGWPLSGDVTPLVLGANIDLESVGGFWNGAIDDVRLYNRALAPSEVAQLARP